MQFGDDGQPFGHLPPRLLEILGGVMIYGIAGADVEVASRSVHGEDVIYMCHQFHPILIDTPLRSHPPAALQPHDGFHILTLGIVELAERVGV